MRAVWRRRLEDVILAAELVPCITFLGIQKSTRTEQLVFLGQGTQQLGYTKGPTATTRRFDSPLPSSSTDMLRREWELLPLPMARQELLGLC